MFVSNLLFQGGILSFENIHQVLNYFHKTMARINDQISSINSKAYLKAKQQMLPILSKTAKVTSVAIAEQFRVYIL